MAGVKVEIKPIYVLHGNDQFLLDTWRKEIVSRLVGDADPQVCVTSFDASAELAEVLDELRTLPFLAPYRVVIVRDADAFVSAHRDALENYLDRPCQSASLVLMVSSFPKNTRLYKAVA
ncbi:MAG: DNA polymerase III subunit delta, partial [Planctomycetota bacterium]